MYQALYRKYRPKNFEDLVGQKIIIKTLKNIITNGNLTHAYLFTGPRGTGKTSTAKLFAKTINCTNRQICDPCNECVNCTQFEQNTDIIEIDAASNNGVDEIRELKSKIGLVPSIGKYKIYIIDEVHMLTTGAFNALLKTLEEPPSHAIFILATTEPYKIPETILSRCQRFDFKRIDNVSIKNKLKYIAEKEKVLITDEALEEIASDSEGGLRDAINLLDQASIYSNNDVKINDIHEINGTLTSKEIKEFINDIEISNLKGLMKKIDLYNTDGKSLIKINEKLIEYYKYNFIEEYCNDSLSKKQFENYEESLKKLNILKDGLLEIKSTTSIKLTFELIIIRLISLNNKSIMETKKEQNLSTKKQLIEGNTDKTTSDNKNIKDTKSIEYVRVNNSLAGFDKKEMEKIKSRLDSSLKPLLTDSSISKYVSMILDGEVKIVGNDIVVFVYNNSSLSSLFNSNLEEIESILFKLFGNKYKAVAINNISWEITKKEYNSKKKKYCYIEEQQISKEKSKDLINNMFESIVEYK